MQERVRQQLMFFKQNPHPMWIYDMKTLKILMVNDAAIDVYGYSAKEFLSLTIKDIRPEEDVPAVIDHLENLNIDPNRYYHWSGIWRHKRKNNELIYVEVSSYEIVFREKKANLVLAYNITEKILQDQKLQGLNQELERKVIWRTNDLLQLNRKLVDQNKVIKSANHELVVVGNQLQDANKKIKEHADLKTRFVSMASHEFRTPLANINFAASFVRRNLKKLDPESITAKLQSIETQVSHMAALLDDLLTIGKSDGVKLKMEPNSVNIQQFIAKIIDEVQTANSQSHQIQVRMDENVPCTINTDEKFLRNIFINLLNNAIKYSPEHKTVYLNISYANENLAFEIIDKGFGIHENDMVKIFEPFYRTSNSQNIQGTGLGLSIVKKAADLLNAQIQVQSTVGNGSNFTVTLPV
jgi:PAS domain S-box-containing protein